MFKQKQIGFGPVQQPGAGTNKQQTTTNGRRYLLARLLGRVTVRFSTGAITPLMAFTSPCITYRQHILCAICTADPRTQACGWAWVQKPNVPNEEWDGRGMYGTMVGPQTVPRSELTALNRLLTFLIPLEGSGALDVYTDNKAVYNVWHKGPRVCHGSLGDLWSICWDLTAVIQQRG